MTEITRNAMIAIVGRPNVGKSTLINALVGERIAAVSKKPQTTRGRILGALNSGDTQLVFIDTPGFHKPRNKLGEQMIMRVRESITDIDAAVLVVEPTIGARTAETALIENLKAASVPCILVINKLDKVSPGEILPVIAEYSALHDFKAILPVSALTREGTDDLVSELLRFASEGPALFPDGTVTDQPEIVIIAEIIREKFLKNLESEVPHGIAIDIVKFSERGDEDDAVIDIEAEIYCEKKTHKAIIIGKNGSMIKKVGIQSRAEIEQFMGTRVNLQTWVKVREGWRDNAAAIRRFGLSE